VSGKRVMLPRNGKRPARTLFTGARYAGFARPNRIADDPGPGDDIGAVVAPMSGAG
jgi:hypothetical protein